MAKEWKSNSQQYIKIVLVENEKKWSYSVFNNCFGIENTEFIEG